MRTITQERLDAFVAYLQQEERSEGTIEKYIRDVINLKTYLAGREVTKELAIAWKQSLMATHTPVTVNSMLSAVNSFFRFQGWEDCRMKFLRVQRQLFRSQSKELTREEYERLLETAKQSGQFRLALVMETICATGIRVSELRHITVESLRAGRVTVSLKGKIRTILLPSKLCRKLQKYAKNQKIVSGEVFLTKNGTSLTRKQIWAEMKTLCEKAQVEPSKVFPHNLRHLFARIFYSVSRDVAKLADILGHSSLETTRIYLVSTGEEHQKQIDQLALVS